jgi:hypothetical protein
MTSSISSNPPILPAVHTLSSSVTTRQSRSPSPTVPPPSSAAQNDVIMTSSVLSNPPVLPAVHTLTPSVTTRQSRSPSPTVPPPSSAAQNDVILSSSGPSDPPPTLPAIYGLTLSVTARRSGSPPATTPPPTPIAQNDVIMSSCVPSQSSPPSPTMLLPTSALSYHPAPEISASNERFPSATTRELTTPSSPIAPLTPGTYEDTLPVPKADPTLPHALPVTVSAELG